jgi:hypothetical protein
MKAIIVVASVVAMAGITLLSAGPANADSLSIGVRTDSVSLGVNIGEPPRIVAVPGTSVYHAPSLPHNYFVHGGHYYLFRDGSWLAGASYNGPWTVIAVERVPPPVLAVPVDYYKVKPSHWKKGGPPPWAEAKGHDKQHKEKHGKKGKHRNDD